MYHTRNGLDELDEKKQPLVGSITRVSQGNMGDYKGTTGVCSKVRYVLTKFMANVIPSRTAHFFSIRYPVFWIRTFQLTV
jgi:hypothetical protein